MIREGLEGDQRDTRKSQDREVENQRGDMDLFRHIDYRQTD